MENVTLNGLYAGCGLTWLGIEKGLLTPFSSFHGCWLVQRCAGGAPLSWEHYAGLEATTETKGKGKMPRSP